MTVFRVVNVCWYIYVLLFNNAVAAGVSIRTSNGKRKCLWQRGISMSLTFQKWKIIGHMKCMYK